MLFSSLEFIFLFLPLTLAVYFLTPTRFKNLVLLLSGLAFYAFGEPKFLPVMMLTIVADFLFGIWIAHLGDKKRAASRVLVLAVAYNIGQLAFFKYFNFLGIGLPIGISFYTFQALSYVIDVYRREVEANRNIVDFGAYVSLFPQLIAGPIVRYSDVERELKSRKHTLERAASGFRTFVAGLAKKVLLANGAGAMWEIMRADTSFLGAYLGIFFFATQIYFDFSGYSDMAVGLGRVLGFDFPENFNYPYISRSITEFWRRWHITLSTWFREYVYIPLGGNRRGKARTYLNLLVTWALTGIWHRATVNFLLWGLYFALILIIEKAFLHKLLVRVPSFISHIYALFFIALGWVIFVSDGGAYDGILYAGRLLGVGCSSLYSGSTLYELVRNIVFVLILVIGCTSLPKRIYLKVKGRARIGDAFLGLLAPLAVFILSVAYIVSSGYNPFLYFRF